MTREILSAPEKEFVLLSFMPIKLLSGGMHGLWSHDHMADLLGEVL